VKSLVGYDGVLNQNVGRIRTGLYSLIYQACGLCVLQSALGLSQVLKEAGQQLSFIGIHNGRLR
jgi:hypothetical protein